MGSTAKIEKKKALESSNVLGDSGWFSCYVWRSRPSARPGRDMRASFILTTMANSPKLGD